MQHVLNNSLESLNSLRVESYLLALSPHLIPRQDIGSVNRELVYLP